MTKSDAIASTVGICAQIYSDLDTAVSRHARELLLTGRYRELVELDVDPSTYSDAESFSRDYLAVSLLSKYPNLDTKIDRKAKAIEKFHASEQRCVQAYWNMRRLRSGRFNKDDHPDLAGIFHTARRLLERTLGPFNWDEVEPLMGFGPGAAVKLPYRLRDRWYKFGSLKPTVTPACSVLALCAIMRIPRWFSHLRIASGKEPSDCLSIVRGNAVTTVPKNAKTDRIIAKEPLLNAFVQRGIGRVMRARLKRVGINLDSQEKNQELAKLGSLTDSLATIDLSAASDSVSLALVEELVPEDWVQAIKLTRSQYGVLPDGASVLYRKVSSMGNGYTFELESLLFWALTKATLLHMGGSDQTISVYGDDIICPSPQAGAVVSVLRFAGFDVNDKKTFLSGPFRESCGKHYFRGSDVTPFYVRDDVKSVDRLFWAANRIKYWSFLQAGSCWGLDSRLRSSYELVISMLPERRRRPTMPLLRDGNVISDCALGGDFDEVAPAPLNNARKGWIDGFEGSILHPVFRVERDLSQCDSEVRSYPLLLKCLWALEARDGPCEPGGSGTPSQILGKRVGWRSVKVPIPRWEDAGCWL